MLELDPTSISHDRQIRVFISSTFRDMQEERDILVKKVFPQLRKLCEKRAVAWTEVDLRWGITDEQKAEGRVLPLCLHEIRRCRPYFIGLLGERYGWIPEPDAISADLVSSQPWLKQHVYDKTSVTELEILHGVFTEELAPGHAYFYFRAPAYAHSRHSLQRKNFISENEESARKLERLKRKIRAARDGRICQLRENYTDPEQLGEWILADFTRLIDAIYPEEQVPDALDLEGARHEAYARSRRLAFIGRGDVLRSLDEYASMGGKPVVLTGESGCGKSALMAEWAARWRRAHPEDLIIQHYIGSTPDSAEWQVLVRRVLAELKRAFDIANAVPLQPKSLRCALGEWAAKAAGTRRVVLVLDALNQLADDAGAQQLGWLPAEIPSNFRILVSSLAGESLDVLLNERMWREIPVPLFTSAEIVPAANAFFEPMGRKLPEKILAKLSDTKAACNALYLRAVLDELRQFGIHEELEAVAADYLSTPGPEELFERILHRWEQDFGQILVRDSLSLIWAARHGLAESELLDLLCRDNQPLPRAEWTPFLLAVENALVLRAGLLSFGHNHLRTAVQRRYLATEEEQKSIFLRLADFFEKIPELTDHKLDEMPWLLCKAQEWARAKQFLTDMDAFRSFSASQRRLCELNRYWLAIEPYCDPVVSYEEALEKWAQQTLFGAHGAVFAHAANEVGLFHYYRGAYAAAEACYRRSLEAWEASAGKDHFNVGVSLNNLALLLVERNQLKEAEPLYRRALQIHESELGSDHREVAVVGANLARLLLQRADLQGAEVFFRRSIAGFEKSEGANHPDVAVAHSGRGAVLMELGRLDEAEAEFRKALETNKAAAGVEDSRQAGYLGSLAVVLKITGRKSEAEALYRQAIHVTEVNYGPRHHDCGNHCFNLASLCAEAGRIEEAEALFSRALSIWEAALGEHHPFVARALLSLGDLLRATNRWVEAESMLRRALAISEQELDLRRPDVARALIYLSVLLRVTRRVAEAEPLLSRALHISESYQGDNAGLVRAILNEQAIMLQALSRPAEAETVMERTLDMDIKAFGKQHPEAASAISDYQTSVHSMGQNPGEVMARLRMASPDFARWMERSEALKAHNMARALEEIGDMASAEKMYRKAIQIDPRDSINHTNFAGLLLATGALDEAERRLDAAQELIGAKVDRYAARIFFLRAAIAAIRGRDYGPFIDQLKSILRAGFTPMPSRNSSVIQALEKKLDAGTYSLFAAIYEAINDGKLGETGT